MWKYLYQMASPKLFYKRTQAWLPTLGWAAFFFLLIGTIWGLVYAPADYQQGDAFRIIYIHVPCAFLSLGLYTAIGFFGLLLLIWKIKIAGILLRVTIPLGACMAFLALATGSIWGKPMWGAFWVWDARLTSELILLLLYIALLITSIAFKNKQQGDKIVSLLALVGVVDLPIIHYSVFWWNTLHQGSTLTVFSKPKIAAVMLYPLLITLAGFCLYCLWFILRKAGSELLLKEKKQTWVRQIVEGGTL
jgi:heme exporter protein C